MISRTFTIIAGEYTGLRIWDHLMLEKKDETTGERIPNYKGLIAIRRWLERHPGVQYPEDDIGLLEEIVLQINTEAPMVRIKSKTVSYTDGNTSTYVDILELLGESPDGTPTPEPEPVDEVATEEAAQDDGSSAEELAWLIAFAAKQGITEINDGMASEQIVAILLTYQYNASELLKEEQAWLIAMGLPESQIIQPAPAPKPAAPKAPKAPAAPAPKPAAPKAPALPPRLGAPKK
jgi:hypothetical protein